MLLISDNDIKQNYLMADALKDLKKGLLSKNKGLIMSPQRTVLGFPDYDASALYMPSADLVNNISAIKIVSIFPHNPKEGKSTTQAVLVLTDTTNGEHLCTMSATYLTRLRTGALSGSATDKLARKRSTTLGVIGTGEMAFEQVLGVLEVRDITHIYLYNRTSKKAQIFKQKLIDFGVAKDIEVVDSVNEVVENVDIICCSTRSKDPVFNGSILKDGTHINGVGSYLPNMREVDLTTIQRASKIVVDDLHGIKEEAGELIYAHNKGDWNFSNIHSELCEITEDKQIRETDDEITFFKSVGAGYFDLIIAIGVYKKMQLLKMGSNVPLI